MFCLVDHSSYSQEEKNYIYEWVGEHLETKGGDIPWTTLQSKMETRFGKFRSRNGLKNIWNARKRLEARNKTKNRVKIEPSILEVGYEHKDDGREMKKIVDCKMEGSADLEMDVDVDKKIDGRKTKQNNVVRKTKKYVVRKNSVVHSNKIHKTIDEDVC